jgi:hypothetical protein
MLKAGFLDPLRPCGQENYMRRKALVALITCMVFVTYGGAAEQDKGADKMLLSGGSPGDVPFPHHVHQSILGDCKVCHNLFPQIAGSIERLKAEGKLKKKRVMDQCKACHKQRVKAEKKSGPVRCRGCHKRQT